MKKESFFHSLNSKDRYMIGNLFFLYLIQGIYTILIGSILPMLKAEYGLSYQIGGYLISAQSTGNIAAGLFAGLIPLMIGLKNSLMILNVLPYAGFAIALATGNPWLLVFAFLLTGLGRGSISNYNNQAVSTLSGGNSSPLNALHGFFAIGAVSAPLIALACAKTGDRGWRLAVCIIIGLGILSIFTSAFMKMDSVSYSRTESGGNAFGFLKEKPFLFSLVIMFLYLCVEATVMGWMVTYYEESGVIAPEAAQLLTSLLWITILVGRFGCSAFGGRTTPVSSGSCLWESWSFWASSCLQTSFPLCCWVRSGLVYPFPACTGQLSPMRGMSSGATPWQWESSSPCPDSDQSSLHPSSVPLRRRPASGSPCGSFCFPPLFCWPLPLSTKKQLGNKPIFWACFGHVLGTVLLYLSPCSIRNKGTDTKGPSPITFHLSSDV